MTSLLTTLLAAAALGAEPAADSTLKVDAAKVVNRVSPLMYGSCIEDVNHEIYGGLYAQMIFGESFEEPPRGPGVAGWKAYGGHWTARDGVLSVAADFGAKAVRDEPILGDGTVSCDIRLKDDKGYNASLILRVSDPRPGADSWIGYEVGLSARDHHLMLGRHRNDFHELKRVPADIVAGRWHRLKVEMAGARLRIYLDDAKEPAIDYTDASEPIASGRVGVRTWGSDAEFRDLVVERPEGKVVERFEVDKGEDLENGLSGAWDVCSTMTANLPRLTWDSDRPFNSGHSQKIEIPHGTAEDWYQISNRGLNRTGLAVRGGRRYAGSLYVRGNEGSSKISVGLADNTDGIGPGVAKDQALAAPGKGWSRRTFSLLAEHDCDHAAFTISLRGPGPVWVDQVYLSGTEDDLFCGLPIRRDIAMALQEEGLTLLRYGGCMTNAPEYRWKKMIGDRDKRPQYKGWWYPQTTNGFGIEEFVQFCRAAKFEPVVAINVEETPEDAADLVEYLNGPATSEWGKKRAANGHPEPYGVKYIEIGNEETTNEHYIERFKLLHAAMKPKDPGVEYIIAAWWEPDNKVTRKIVEELNGKAALWDVHVGGDNPREGANVDATFTRMRKLVNEWAPGTGLKACVLEENGGKHNLARALGHATVLNATQRHGDFVLIDCPANCLQAWKQNDNDWDQGQLFYDSSHVWRMPPYYAQQMAAAAHLPCRVASEVKSPGDDLDVTATRDEAGTELVLKVVNVGNDIRRTDIALDGFGPVAPGAEVAMLSGALDDVNGPEGPERIKPVRFTFGAAAAKFRYEFAARSYTVMRLKRQ